MLKRLLILFALLSLIAFGAFYFQKEDLSKKIGSFEECVNAGFPVMESYPPQCKTDAGASFTQDIGNELEMAGEIIIEFPRPGSVVSSPLKIKGMAKGSWFFEANAQVKLVDSSGEEVSTGAVTAVGNWMTEEFVDFSGIVNFDKKNFKKGELILKNANPSGLPENNKELRIPVKF